MGGTATTQNIPFLQQDLIGNTKGFFAPYIPDRVLGARSGIGNTRVDLWQSPTTTTYVFPTVGQQFQVVSDNANDTANGTGARSVHVHLLSDAYGLISEIVNMNGLTPVLIGPPNGFRVNGFHVTSVGSLGASAGNLSLTGPAGAVTYGYIPAGYNMARQAVYTVPAGYQGYISGWRSSSGSAGSHICTTDLRMTAHNNVLYPGTFLSHDEIATQNTGDSYIFPIPVAVPATADVKVSAIGDALNAGISAYAMIMGWSAPI